MSKQLTVLYAHSLLRCWFPSSQGNHSHQRSCRRLWRGCPLPWSNLRRDFCRTRLLSSGARFPWQILWPLWSWCKWVLGYSNKGKTCCWAGRDAAYGNTSLGVRAYLSTTKTMKRKQWVQKIRFFLKEETGCNRSPLFLFPNRTSSCVIPILFLTSRDRDNVWNFMSSLPFFLLPVPAVTFLLPVVLAEWVAQRLTVCCSLAFCSLLELVVTSLKTGPGWWSGAGGWRKLWGRSFSSKPMRWSWISKNWATFRLIHSWKSTWHLCWWRCWNELTYIIFFPALIIIFLLLWSPALHLTGKKKHCISYIVLQGVLPSFTKPSLHLWGVGAGEVLRPETLDLYERERPYGSLNTCIWVIF